MNEYDNEEAEVLLKTNFEDSVHEIITILQEEKEY